MSDGKLKQISFRQVSVGLVFCYEWAEAMRCSIDIIFIFDLVHTIMKFEAILNRLKLNVTKSPLVYADNVNVLWGTVRIVIKNQTLY
jgi:hypothetical protein